MPALLPGCSEERAVTMSPDGAYHLSYDRHNLILTEQKTGEQSQLTFDGEPDLEYGCYIDIYSQITVKRQGYQEHPQVLWSPDGTGSSPIAQTGELRKSFR